MDRLDVELYADRVARHAERLADEVAAARLRLAWAALEGAARGELAAGDALVLEAIGVLGTVVIADDEALIHRRRRQLEALDRLQAIVEQRLAELRPVR
jgi:hypothetical protein